MAYFFLGHPVDYTIQNESVDSQQCVTENHWNVGLTNYNL